MNLALDPEVVEVDLVVAVEEEEEVEEAVGEVEEMGMDMDVDGAEEMEEEAEEDGDGEEIATEEYGVLETVVVVGFPVVIKSQRKVNTNQHIYRPRFTFNYFYMSMFVFNMDSFSTYGVAYNWIYSVKTKMNSNNSSICSCYNISLS